MPVCRICLKQSFKEVYDLEFGLPTVREKLIICMPVLDIRLLDNSYVICEICLTALNTAYELREKLLAAQSDIKSLMTAANIPHDFENLEKYAFEASMRRDRYNLHDSLDLGIETKDEEQLTSIAFLESSDSLNSSDPLQVTVSPRSGNSSPRYDLSLGMSSVVSAVNLSNATIVSSDSKSMHLETSSSPPAPTAGTSKAIPVDNSELLMQFVEGRMCHICYRQYPNKTCLQSHIKAVHESNTHGIKRKLLNNLLGSLTPRELADINKEVAKKCVETECDDCKIVLRCMHEMEYHLTAIHKKLPINTVHFTVRCLICNVSFNHSYLELHMRGHELKVKLTDILQEQSNILGRPGGTGPPFMVVQFWHCEICNVIFKNSEQSIDEHLKLHRQNNDEIIIS